MLVTAAVALLAVVVFAPAAGAGQASPPAPPQSSCPSDDPAVFRPCVLEKAKTFTPPRTPDGKPDLNGLWRRRAAAHESLEAHPKTFDDSGGPSVVVDPPDGKVPIQAWADAKRKESFKKYADHNTACLMSGVPRHLYMTGNYQFLQTPDHVVLLSEEAHAYRVIPLNGSPHIGKDLLTWQGDSRGRWEGNVLVVETLHQNGRAWLDQRATFYTEAAKVTERFTFADADTILYEATLEDPNVYTRPFTIAFPLRRNASREFELWEEACHEGEATMKHLYAIGLGIYPGISVKQAVEFKQAFEKSGR
jgi:hypothetical protein